MYQIDLRDVLVGWPVLWFSGGPVMGTPVTVLGVMGDIARAAYRRGIADASAGCSAWVADACPFVGHDASFAEDRLARSAYMLGRADGQRGV